MSETDWQWIQTTESRTESRERKGKNHEKTNGKNIRMYGNGAESFMRRMWKQ